MNKIRRNLFSNLQKTAGGMSFRRVIHVGLMTAIFILAGCSSKPIPSATATSTRLATATFTATLEPTPTIAPKPDYVNEDNSVETDNGTVFVKDGKAMIYDTRTGEVKEIENIFTKVTFNTPEDSSKIVRELHADEYASQTREDFLPGRLSEIQAYVKAVDRVSYRGPMDKGTMIPLLGTVDEVVNVKYPLESDKFDSMSLMMVRVLDNSEPIPVVLGVFSNDGSFYSFYEQSSQGSVDAPRERKYQSLESLPWFTLQGRLKGNIVYLTPFYALTEASSTILDDESGPYVVESISPTVVQERNRLLQLVAELAKYGEKVGLLHDYKLGNVGSAYSEVRQLYQGDGKAPYFFVDGDNLLEINVVK